MRSKPVSFSALVLGDTGTHTHTHSGARPFRPSSLSSLRRYRGTEFRFPRALRIFRRRRRATSTYVYKRTLDFSGRYLGIASLTRLRVLAPRFNRADVHARIAPHASRLRAHVTRQLFEAGMKKMKKRGPRALETIRVPRPRGNEAGRAARPPGRREARPPGEEDGGGWAPREVRRLGYPVPLDREREFREAADRESCPRDRDGEVSRGSSRDGGPAVAPARTPDQVDRNGAAEQAGRQAGRRAGRKSIACTTHAACFDAPIFLRLRSGAERAGSRAGEPRLLLLSLLLLPVSWRDSRHRDLRLRRDELVEIARTAISARE